MQSRIMYVGGPSSGKIVRVDFSQSGRTAYYDNRTFLKSKQCFGKANFIDIQSGEEVWISGCNKEGRDTLYPGIVEIDEDVRYEYWTEIRVLPQFVNKTSFRSEGKRSRRKPK